MVLTHIPQAIGKLRLPLPPAISLEYKTVYTHLDRGGPCPHATNIPRCRIFSSPDLQPEPGAMSFMRRACAPPPIKLRADCHQGRRPFRLSLLMSNGSWIPAFAGMTTQTGMRL
jgi:hypothetical protein